MFHQKMMWVSGGDYKCAKHCRKRSGRKNFKGLNKIGRVIFEEILMVSGSPCGPCSNGTKNGTMVDYSARRNESWGAVKDGKFVHKMVQHNERLEKKSASVVS
jgi:hypothetical protein